MPTEDYELDKGLIAAKIQNKILNENHLKYERAEKNNCIDLSYAGGKNGIVIIEKIVKQAKVIEWCDY